MGCINSQPDDDVEKDIADADLGTERKKIVQKQRRRLSVTPQHVGDISAATKALQAGNTSDISLDVKARGNMLHSAKTKKGFVPYNKNKVNQDRAIVKYGLQDDDDICVFGVADGHGEFGHHVAAFVQDKLPMYLTKEKKLKTHTCAAITSAVKNMCEELKEKTNIDTSFSGTTLVFGVKIKNKFYVANLGDSRCVLARAKSGTATGYTAIGLSEDQKPEDPLEKARILKAGGRVHPLPGPPGEDCGPDRVWLAEVDVPGLAMARSVGDMLAHTVGVSSIPEIKEHDLTPEDTFIIWASDGVWEFIENQQAVDLVAPKLNDLAKAATALVAESDKRWKAEEEVIDDITCVVLQFKKPEV